MVSVSSIQVPVLEGAQFQMELLEPRAQVFHEARSAARVQSLACVHRQLCESDLLGNHQHASDCAQLMGGVHSPVAGPGGRRPGGRRCRRYPKGPPVSGISVVSFTRRRCRPIPPGRGGILGCAAKDSSPRSFSRAGASNHSANTILRLLHVEAEVRLLLRFTWNEVGLLASGEEPSHRHPLGRTMWCQQSGWLCRRKP